ncbi:hypothetical protein ACFWY5_25805 [Nonomuraea sp. NPDC059007]|uniref:hypothetical protein n=1 Tax=Nonomuraea sp. NPDC059007 TaxID=3346692 RepID=UPI0036B365A6
MERALRKSGTTTVDAKALMGAAKETFPGWFRPLVTTRFLLTTAGSLAILVSLAAS